MKPSISKSLARPVSGGCARVDANTKRPLTRLRCVVEDLVDRLDLLVLWRMQHNDQASQQA